jgi:putative ABC transport system substrate-binding protein
MRRTTVGIVTVLVLCVLAVLCAVEAQQPQHVARIGILAPTLAPHDPGSTFQGFRQGLRDLGYVEGQNIALEYRDAEGKRERLPERAAELLRLKVDILLALGTHAALAAQHAGGTMPIIFLSVPDPVGLGLVASLARPGRTITGLTLHNPELMGKRLELRKATVPGVTRVGYLWHTSAFTARNLPEAETAARALGLELHPVEVREPYPFDQAFATMAEAHVEAFITQPSPEFFSRRRQLADVAARRQLPGIFPDRGLADVGGLMAYGRAGQRPGTAPPPM